MFVLFFLLVMYSFITSLFFFIITNHTFLIVTFMWILIFFCLYVRLSIYLFTYCYFCISKVKAIANICSFIVLKNCNEVRKIIAKGNENNANRNYFRYHFYPFLVFADVITSISFENVKRNLYSLGNIRYRQKKNTLDTERHSRGYRICKYFDSNITWAHVFLIPLNEMHNPFLNGCAHVRITSTSKGLWVDGICGFTHV